MNEVPLQSPIPPLPLSPEEACRLLGRGALADALADAVRTQRVLGVSLEGPPGSGRALLVRAVIALLQRRGPVLLCEPAPDSLRGRDPRSLAAELYRRVIGPTLVPHGEDGRTEPRIPFGATAALPREDPRTRTLLLLDRMDGLAQEEARTLLGALGWLHGVPRLSVLAVLDPAVLGLAESLPEADRVLLDRAFHLRLRIPRPSGEDAAAFINEWLRRAGVPSRVTPEEAEEALGSSGGVLGLERRLHAFRFLRGIATPHGLRHSDFDGFFWGRAGCGTGSEAFARLLSLCPIASEGSSGDPGVAGLDEDGEVSIPDLVLETGGDAPPEPPAARGAENADAESDCSSGTEDEDGEDEEEIRGLEPALFRANSANPRSRRGAAAELGRLREPRGVPTLVGLLRDGDGTVRQSALCALQEIGDPGAVPHVIPLLAAEDAGTRRTAASVLGRMGDTAALPGLLALLRDENPEVRCAVAAALGAAGDRSCTRPLLLATADRHAVARRAFLSALERLVGRIGIAPVAECLADPSVEVRRGAARLLSEIGPQGEEASGPLLRALEDEDPTVRRHAVCALARQGGVEALDGLFEMLSDPDAEVRSLCRERIEKSAGADLPRILLQRLADPARAAAAEEALRGLEPKALVRVLEEALAASEPRIRAHAATLLGEHGDSQAVDALRVVQDQDWEPEVRRAAAAALVRLGVDGSRRPARGRAL